jgi:magnesium transporter
MARFILDRKASSGKAPGSVILIGDRKMDKPVIQLIEYDLDTLVERELGSIEETIPLRDSEKVSWINIYGIHDLEMIQRVGEIFGLHPLILEDLLNTDQRPVYQDADTYDGFIMKMLDYDSETSQIMSEQFTMILGEHYVLTFQEKTRDVFNPVRERIRTTGRIRLNDCDYLAYALMDTIVDNYIVLIETLGRKVEELEERLFRKPDRALIEEIYNLKTELSFLRKSIRPVREMMSHLMKSESSYFQEKNRHYLGDLEDLVVQAAEAIELYSGMISDHLNIYSTSVSNRINEVMKVLTVFASIFIPLTFLAGVYGMNFEHIPELKFKYSYPVFWTVAILIGLGLLRYFKRKRWF